MFKHSTNATLTVFMRSRNRHVGSTLRSAQPASSVVSSSSSKAPRRWCAPLKTKRSASNSLKAWAWRSCSNSNSCAFVGLCGGVAARTAEGGGARNAARMSPLGTWTSGRTGVSKVDMLSMRSAANAPQRAGFGWAAAEWFQQPLSRFTLVQGHAQQQHYSCEVFVRVKSIITLRTACCSACKNAPENSS